MIGKLGYRYVYPNQVRIYSQIGTISEPCSDINMLYAIPRLKRVDLVKKLTTK
ncbi:MAG: hypothetical protein AEth_00130 [Candidatus Argoarchaeum ethanivorans]|uniref:Uncharacterized protein n=1 Tax=Candidatus Argoarchaeum ethanivorans TaxID=2608793 RepID=A0A8B3S3Y0_9EURY|nr:MAG: hypothetical protein AEth_00130 [Candidatus Argoarchaeum ethanivorans]